MTSRWQRGAARLSQGKDCNVDTHPDDLRAGVVRGAAAGLQHRPQRLQRGHPEVRNLYIVLVVQQQVLRLQVSVAAMENMKV